MKKPVDIKELAFASITQGNELVKIEKLPVNEAGQEQIRFSIWSQGKMLPRPLSLTQKELVTLLQAAIREGILSRDFTSELHSVNEI
jgi:hypothetical protein